MRGTDLNLKDLGRLITISCLIEDDTTIESALKELEYNNVEELITFLIRIEKFGYVEIIDKENIVIKLTKKYDELYNF